MTNTPTPVSTLSDDDHARFWNVVAPAFGLDTSFVYSEADIAEHLADYDQALPEEPEPAPPPAPFLSLTAENRAVILRAAADTWVARCAELALKAGTKGRQRELEAYLQGVLAVATASRLMTHQEAAQVAFLVAINRGEEQVARWAAYRTDAEAAEDVRKRTAGAAAEQLLPA